jgi:hypothetical protein
MYKKTTPKLFKEAPIKQFPHCDPRILHAPTECEFCDGHKDWQFLRMTWGVAFTGWEPSEKELPDPATHARGYENANAWGGNKAKPTPHNHLGGVFISGCPACEVS